ncbi:MAG: Glu-tRNA(Gln) amidotransferase subunit GatD [Proteobacteria bacterium]|jgi:glutamyl-tRNA(Gln) amidotransferase subunit D|nr:Glu-tRNA(Gln) amidotransferase subunit GatD [Pseudomonadota bacterium]
MSDNAYKGYRGRARALLEANHAPVWSDVVVASKRGTFKGIILPRSETDDDQHLVLKMVTGYNVGIRVEDVEEINAKEVKEAHYKIPEKEFPYDPVKKNVTLLGTGGTIASRLDYRTGAVIPAFSPGELFGAVPELADICNMTTKKLYGVFSENIGPEIWMGTAAEVVKAVEGGADGIIIGHGTDTMHYSSAALSFMCQDLPVPVVIVGSQRSSDRPSSDAALNLRNAATAASIGPAAEVMVCMFGPTSDEYDLLHRGTRVRKMHSSYRSTFRTIGDRPMARVWPGRVEMLTDDYVPRDKSRKPRLINAFEERVAILYYYPNMQPDVLDAMIDNGYKGIVIAGTGLGHVNKPLYPSLKKAHDKGIHLFMTVQTLWGYVGMFVYDTGRDMMALGVVPAKNMLPEVAYVKLGWVLGQTQDPEEVRRMMLAPVNHEITDREPIDGYLIMQGGIPEVDIFMKDHIR